MDPSSQPQQITPSDQPQPSYPPVPGVVVPQSPAPTAQDPAQPVPTTTQSTPYSSPQPDYSAPVQPQPYGAPVQYPQNASAGKNNKIIIIIASIVGGLLLLTGAIIVLLLVFGGPTKADYSKAAQKISEANSAYNDMSLKSYDLASSSSTETSRKNAQETIKTKMTVLNTTLQEAGNMKAVKRDKDVNAKYIAVEAKRAKFNVSMEKMLDISDKFVPVYVELSDMSSTSTANDIAAAQTKLEGIGTLKDDATNTFVTASINFLKAVGEYSTYRETYINGGAYNSNAYTKYNAATNTYYDALKDWQSSLEKMSDDAELKNELNALADVLNTKILEK